MRALALFTFGIVLAACGRSDLNSSSIVQSEPSNDLSIVEFHITDGTGKGPWNTKETAVMMKVGEVLRIFNDDKIVHQLHTNGAPFGHGNAIKAGTYLDHLTKKPFQPTTQAEEIYDHLAGPSATFYIRVQPAHAE